MNTTVLDKLIIPAPTKEEILKSLMSSPKTYLPDFDILQDGSILIHRPSEEMICYKNSRGKANND